MAYQHVFITMHEIFNLIQPCTAQDDIVEVEMDMEEGLGIAPVTAEDEKDDLSAGQRVAR